MSHVRRVVSVSLAVALGAAAVSTLSACSPQQLVQNAIQDATGVDVNTGAGASMPEGWPSSVPVVSGTIQSSMVMGDPGAQTWTVTISVSDPAAAYADAKSQLEGAGFTMDLDTSMEGTYGGMFSNPDYSLIVSTTSDSTGSLITYVLGNGSNSTQ